MSRGSTGANDGVGRHPMVTRSSSRGAAKAASNAIADWVATNLDMGGVTDEKFMGGSSWSSAYQLTTSSGSKLFVKTSQGRDVSMFRGEVLGLTAMYDTHSLRIPRVHHYGELPGGPGGTGSFIVMEHLDMNGGGPDQAELGRRLAQMHLATPTDPTAASGQFGFPVDNTIGGTPQPNAWSSDWVAFFKQRRIGHMIDLAGDARMKRQWEALSPRVDALFEGLDIKPSVLHGDLWSGNIGAVGGEPVIFDPATYYGHHEAEFGMSWCAGFSSAFWSAYHDIIPKAPGWSERHQLYTLYHYLNHYVLFGGGYAGSCTRIMDDLLKKL